MCNYKEAHEATRCVCNRQEFPMYKMNMKCNQTKNDDNNNNNSNNRYFDR
jgi:hypothetical protein